MIKLDPITDDDLLRIGEEVAHDPTCRGLCRGSGGDRRPLTNIEMHAHHFYVNAQRWARREAVGCCETDGELMSDGICTGMGKCPRFEFAEQCKSFASRLLAWLDQQLQPTSVAERKTS